MINVYVFIILRKKIDPTRNIKPKENQKNLKNFKKLSVLDIKENLKGSKSQLSEEQRGNTGIFNIMIPSQIFLTIS